MNVREHALAFLGIELGQPYRLDRRPDHLVARFVLLRRRILVGPFGRLVRLDVVVLVFLVLSNGDARLVAVRRLQPAALVTERRALRRFLRLALRDGHQFQGDAALALFIHIEQMLTDFVHAGTDIVGEG